MEEGQGEMMRVALASDHAGFGLKDGIARYLEGRGIKFEDFGCGPGEVVDYVDYAERAVRGILAGRADRAILICGTGMGMALAANKFRGIRATPCWNAYTAEMSRKHNDSNCLTLGGRVLTLEEALLLVRIWLETEFEAGRHARRVEKVRALEANLCPPDVAKE
jgi:ribose 5-phosphate isomerase B